MYEFLYLVFLSGAVYKRIHINLNVRHHVAKTTNLKMFTFYDIGTPFKKLFKEPRNINFSSREHLKWASFKTFTKLILSLA